MLVICITYKCTGYLHKIFMNWLFAYIINVLVIFIKYLCTGYLHTFSCTESLLFHQHFWIVVTYFIKFGYLHISSWKYKNVYQFYVYSKQIWLVYSMSLLYIIIETLNLKEDHQLLFFQNFTAPTICQGFLLTDKLCN